MSLTTITDTIYTNPNSIWHTLFTSSPLPLTPVAYPGIFDRGCVSSLSVLVPSPGRHGPTYYRVFKEQVFNIKLDCIHFLRPL